MRGGMRLDGVDGAAGADGERGFDGGVTDVCADVDHGVTRRKERANEHEVFIARVTVEPELPRDVGGMNVEAEITQRKREPAAPARAPE